MNKRNGSKSIWTREIAFQVVLYGLVFSFYTFDRNQPRIELFQIVYFLNYTLVTVFVSYFLLPRFFYTKKHLQFFLYLLLCVAFVVLMEELVLEQIFFADTRGKSFPGVFFSLLEVLPVITILVGFKFAWDALIKQREVDELKTTIEESQLQFLTSQINPHFLFNNLNNLYSYAVIQSPKTPKIILELSSVLRYMLYECKSKFVPLAKEIEQLENFVKLNELQIEERGEVNFQTQDIKSGHQIAPLILIVFIENAFKHSQASQSDNINIDIRINLEDDGTLDFKCSNSYQTMTNTESISNGIGLENVKKRLDLIYPQTYALEIEELNDCYRVHLRIQLTKEDQA
ncbi:MAG: histidine kinase [Saprospiraceae bacterium]|nr:histidine kinase [Saprospiraceae bacterium]